MPISPPRIGLFVTCLVDLFRPTVGFAAIKLLEEAGCVVEVPTQTCCGQPAYNSGDRATARSLAQQVIAAFEPLDYVVAPSGSCAGSGDPSSGRPAGHKPLTTTAPTPT